MDFPKENPVLNPNFWKKEEFWKFWRLENEPFLGILVVLKMGSISGPKNAPDLILGQFSGPKNGRT